jgi:hypothetical protein
MALGQEPDIIVNGTKLTTVQAMTVRVALGSFSISLGEGLGDDPNGVAICAGYKRCIGEVHKLMFSK